LFLRAFNQSGGTAYEAFWEAARVAVVGCLHSAVPSRSQVSAVLHEELALSTSLQAPFGFTQVSQLVALTLLDGEDQLRVSRAWAHAFLPENSSAKALAGAALPPSEAAAASGSSAPVAIAYLSCHFGDHPVGHHITSLLQLHSRAAFRVLCFSTVPADGSSTWAANAAACDELQLLPPSLPAAAAAAAIAAQRPQLLIYLDGFNEGHRLDVLALRPSKLQVSFFGFLGSLGLPQLVDAVVSDAVASPEEAAAAAGGSSSSSRSSSSLFGERRVLLHPSTFYVQNYAELHPEVLQAEAAEALPAAHFVQRAQGLLQGQRPPAASLAQAPFSFCATVQLYKVSPGIFSSWLRILAATNGSELLLLEHPPVAKEGLLAAHAEQLAASPGLAGRLRFLQLQGRREHLLSKRSSCSLGLDTPHFNGHTSTGDLLWAGVPVLTLAAPGSGMSGSAAASLIAAAGGSRAHFVASSLQQYEQLALAVWQAYSEPAPREGQRGGGGGSSSLDRELLLWRPLHSAPFFDRAAWVAGFEGLMLQLLREEGQAQGREGTEGPGARLGTPASEEGREL
jgi:hypothetical protein